MHASCGAQRRPHVVPTMRLLASRRPLRVCRARRAPRTGRAPASHRQGNILNAFERREAITFCVAPHTPLAPAPVAGTERAHHISMIADTKMFTQTLCTLQTMNARSSVERTQTINYTHSTRREGLNP